MTDPGKEKPGAREDRGSYMNLNSHYQPSFSLSSAPSLLDTKKKKKKDHGFSQLYYFFLIKNIICHYRLVSPSSTKSFGLESVVFSNFNFRKNILIFIC